MKSLNRKSALVLTSIISASLIFTACGSKDSKKLDDEIVDKTQLEENEDKKDDKKEDKEEIKDEVKEEEVIKEKLADAPVKENLDKMEDLAKDMTKSKDSPFVEVKTKNKDNNWYNIVVVLADEFIEENKDKSEDKLDEVYKDLRKQVYQSLGDSGVLNYNTDNRDITFYYEDKDGNEVRKPSVIKPDSK